MVKIIMLGIWVSALLSGSVYYFAQNNNEKTVEKSSESVFGGLDYIKLEPITVAIIEERRVKGYIIFEAVYTIKQSDKDRLSIPIEYLLSDLVIGSIHGNPDIDIYRLENFDLEAFQQQILKNINTKLGEKTVYDVLIQKIDFISKEDIRDMQLRRS